MDVYTIPYIFIILNIERFLGLGHTTHYDSYKIYLSLVSIPALALSVRRLHDIGKSGWMFLIILIPLIGPIWLLILMVTNGDPEDNEYGTNPKAVLEKEFISRDTIILLIGIWMFISFVVLWFFYIKTPYSNKPQFLVKVYFLTFSIQDNEKCH